MEELRHALQLIHNAIEDKNEVPRLKEAWNLISSYIDLVESASPVEGEKEERPYFKIARNDYGKPFFYYKPSSEENRFNCWLPVDEEFVQEFDKVFSRIKALEREAKDDNYVISILTEQVKALEERLEAADKVFKMTTTACTGREFLSAIEEYNKLKH